MGPNSCYTLWWSSLRVWRVLRLCTVYGWRDILARCGHDECVTPGPHSHSMTNTFLVLLFFRFCCAIRNYSCTNTLLSLCCSCEDVRRVSQHPILYNQSLSAVMDTFQDINSTVTAWLHNAFIAWLVCELVADFAVSLHKLYAKQ